MTENRVYFENVHSYFTDKEIKGVAARLRDHEISLCVDSGAPTIRASFLDIGIFINEHLTEAIAMGLLAPAAYDVLKSSILAATKAIYHRVRIYQSQKTRKADPYIRLQTKDKEINILVPDDLSTDELSKYIDDAITLAANIISICNDNSKHLFIEKDSSGGNTRAITLNQYVAEKKAREK